MKLSVALATYNEEENIEKCLASVFGWCDEIVIVDGKSTDKTVEKTRKYKAKVLLRDNKQNFHLNKQIAIENCKGYWILQLDADEVVSDGLKNEILNIVSIKPKTLSLEPISGYWIPRKNYFLGRFLKKGGQYPDYTLRLYKNGKGYLPAENVHEQAVVTGKTEYLKNPILHYNYPDLRHYLDHFKRYTDIFAEEILENSLHRHPGLDLRSIISFMVIKPLAWFLSTYIRHKGFIDSWQGFLFSFFSSLRFPVSYIKAVRMKK